MSDGNITKLTFDRDMSDGNPKKVRVGIDMSDGNITKLTSDRDMSDAYTTKTDIRHDKFSYRSG
jgi:hypothetical protein